MCCGFIMHVHEANEIELKMDEPSMLIKNVKNSFQNGFNLRLLNCCGNNEVNQWMLWLGELKKIARAGQLYFTSFCMALVKSKII